MAGANCTPGHCYYNCYSDTCSVNAPACSTNNASFGSDVVKGDLIEAAHINDLRIAIDNERTGRRELTEDFPTTVDSNDTIERSHMEDLRDSINEMINQPGGQSVTISSTYSNLISAAEINELRTKINLIRTECVCNSQCGTNARCRCHGYTESGGCFANTFLCYYNRLGRNQGPRPYSGCLEYLLPAFGIYHHNPWTSTPVPPDPCSQFHVTQNPNGTCPLNYPAGVLWPPQTSEYYPSPPHASCNVYS